MNLKTVDASILASKKRKNQQPEFCYNKNFKNKVDYDNNNFVSKLPHYLRSKYLNKTISNPIDVLKVLQSFNVYKGSVRYSYRIEKKKVVKTQTGGEYFVTKNKNILSNKKGSDSPLDPVDSIKISNKRKSNWEIIEKNLEEIKPYKLSITIQSNSNQSLEKQSVDLKLFRSIFNAKKNECFKKENIEVLVSDYTEEVTHTISSKGNSEQLRSNAHCHLIIYTNKEIPKSILSEIKKKYKKAIFKKRPNLKRGDYIHFKDVTDVKKPYLYLVKNYFKKDSIPSKIIRGQSYSIHQMQGYFANNGGEKNSLNACILDCIRQSERFIYCGKKRKNSQLTVYQKKIDKLQDQISIRGQIKSKKKN